MIIERTQNSGSIARQHVGTGLLIGGSLAVLVGAVATAAYFNQAFAQTLHLGSIHCSLLGRGVLFGAFGLGLTTFAVGGALIYSARPWSKKQASYSSHVPTPPIQRNISDVQAQKSHLVPLQNSVEEQMRTVDHRFPSLRKYYVR